MKPSKLPALKRGVSRLGFIPEDVIPALKGGVYASPIKIQKHAPERPFEIWILGFSL
jgi:hypothetical protein